MRLLKKKKNKGSYLHRVSLLCLAAYVAITLVNQQLQINQKKDELANLQSQIRVQEVKNEELTHTIEANEKDGSEYAEQVAREELDYAKTGERVFIIISGE